MIDIINNIDIVEERGYDGMILNEKMNDRKSITEFDKKFLRSLCVIAAIDLFFYFVDTGFLGEMILMFTIPLFMLVLCYDLSMMTIYEVTDSERGTLTYVAGAFFVHLMDLRTVFLNNQGVYAWGAPTFEKVALMPVLALKIPLFLASVFLAFGFARYRFPKIKAQDRKEYLQRWKEDYMKIAEEHNKKSAKWAIASNIVYWGITGFSAGYTVARLLILTGAEWSYDTRYTYAPRGNFQGAEAYLTIFIGLIVMILGVGAWINEGCRYGRKTR